MTCGLDFQHWNSFQIEFQHPYRTCRMQISSLTCRSCLPSQREARSFSNRAVLGTHFSSDDRDKWAMGHPSGLWSHPGDAPASSLGLSQQRHRRIQEDPNPTVLPGSSPAATKPGKHQAIQTEFSGAMKTSKSMINKMQPNKKQSQQTILYLN